MTGFGQEDVQALHRRRVPALRVRTHVRGGGHNVARASRKDARDAVRAARSALPGWAGDDRVQPRAGPVPPRRDDGGACRRPRGRVQRPRRRSRRRSIAPSGTRAGRTSSPRCSASSNPVAGPYFDFTDPGADRGRRDPRAGRAAAPRARLAIAPGARRRQHGRRGRSEASRIAAVELAEALATSDFPGGSVNMLTGSADELAPWLAGHMDVNAIDLTGVERPRRRARARCRGERQARRPLVAPTPRARGRSRRSSS